MAGGVFNKQTNHIQRRDERYQTDGLSCPAGKVVDLSSSGMRIRAGTKPKLRRGDLQSFALSTGSRRLTVQGSVAWVKRLSLFGRDYEMGVRFVNLSPSMRTVLKNLAQYGVLSLAGESGGSSASSTPPRSEEPPSEFGVSAEIELEDHYATLEITREASAEQIRAAFRRLATQYHPDAGGDAETFVRINKAWSVLKDASSKLRYDGMLEQAARKRKSA